MAELYTTTGLVDRVKRRAQIPAANGKLSDQEILDIAYEQVTTRVLPALKGTRENYLLTTTDIPMVADQADYRLPTRTQGGAPRQISGVDAQGDEVPLVPLELTDLFGNREWGTRLRGFIIQGDKITVLPTPTDATESIRVRYYRRFPRLVPVSEAPQITGIAGAVLTCAAGIPAGWATSSELDVTAGRPGFDVLGADLGISSISTPTVTLSAAPSAEVQIGDYVSLAGESPIIQLPDVLHPVVFAFTAAEVLFEVGHETAGGPAYGRAKSALESVVRGLDPRTDHASRRVVSRRSPLRSGGRW